jgi:hypothetical protein
MFAILTACFLAAFIFFTSGYIFSSALVRLCSQKKDDCSFFDTFFSGICVTGMVLSVLSIWLPLNYLVLAGLLILSIIYWLINIRGLKFELNRLADLLNHLPLYSKIAFLLISAAILSMSLLAPFHYDTGLYHLQTLMWNEKFHVVPGLANLHDRLGFNSNFFTLTPIFSLPEVFKQHIFPINALCLLVFFLWCIVASQKTKLFPVKVALVVFPLLIYRIYIESASSLSTDVLPNTLIVYVILNTVFFYQQRPLQNIFLSVIALYSVTLKVSAAPIGLLFLFTIIKSINGKRYKEFFFLAITGSAIVIPWLVRNIILSGYLMYPFPSVNLFNFDWKQPVYFTEQAKDWVTSFGRGTGGLETLSWPLSKWFPIWLKTQNSLNVFLFVCCALSPLIMLFLFIKRKQHNITINVFYCWAVTFLGAAFWFYSAPDFRFNYAFIILTAIIPFIIMWIAFPILSGKNIFYLFYAALMVGLGYTYYKVPKNYSFATLYKPASVEVDGGQKNIQFVQHTIDNYIIYTPIGTDQCFGQPIPCTPIILPNLELRGKTLQDGFRIKH